MLMHFLVMGLIRCAGGGGGTGRGELWVGNKIMRLFSFLYVAASHTADLYCFSCVCVCVCVCVCRYI